MYIHIYMIIGICRDTLHVVYRGYLPEFVGSAIMELARDKLWSTGSLQANLDAAFRSCKLFLETTKLGQLSLDDFSKSSLDGDDGFPSLPGKGHDAKLVALWLPRQTRLWLLRSPSDHARVLDSSLGGKQWLWFFIWFNFVAKMVWSKTRLATTKIMCFFFRWFLFKAANFYIIALHSNSFLIDAFVRLKITRLSAYTLNSHKLVPQSSL